MASELDREKLIAFLRERSEAREVTNPTGLVLVSVYEGLITRITSGEFDRRD